MTSVYGLCGLESMILRSKFGGFRHLRLFSLARQSWKRFAGVQGTALTVFELIGTAFLRRPPGVSTEQRVDNQSLLHKLIALSEPVKDT